MRQLESRVDEALAVAAEVERGLRPGESADTFLTGSAQRQLTLDPAAGKRLAVRNGSLDGSVRFAFRGRELHLNATELTATDTPALLDAARSARTLGTQVPAAETPPLHEDALSWEGSGPRGGLEAVAADPARVTGDIARGAGPDAVLQQVQVTETSNESVFARAGNAPAVSRCSGVEVRAILTGASGTTASLTRYARGLDGIDLVGLGRELALTTAGFGPGERAFDGDTLVFTPHAASQLLRHVVGALLLNPLVRPRGPLCAPVVDDGRAPEAPDARGFDCEGTPTGRIELVGRDGTQHPVATRLHAVAPRPDRPLRLTGHAIREPLKAGPQLAATNVSLAPGGDLADPLAGERCVVVDVRSLGVEEHRSGGQLAFRLLSVRAVDGTPRETFLPVSVEGGAVDFLAAVRAVGPTVSYFPGYFAVAGAHLSLSLSQLLSSRSDVR